MDITRIRNAKMSLRLGTLVEEIMEEKDIEDPMAVVKVQQGLQALRNYDFTFDGKEVSIFESKSSLAHSKERKYTRRRTSTNYNAYAFLRDYLGIGSLSPFLISAVESKYPKITNRCFRRKGPVSYEKLDMIAADLLTFMKDYILNPQIA